ncbi:MAG: hypothetical protein ACRD1Y_03915 [Terriglobales bacterium]
MKYLRYWFWLLCKLAVAALLVLGVWTVTTWVVPPPPTGLMSAWPRLGSDLPYTMAAFLVVVVAFGLGWACAVDQVYRCRTCARRLRMPRTKGNYSHVMLGGAPHTEYICTYGHGRLNVPDVHVSGGHIFRWVGYGSLWEDLIQAERHPER